MRDPKVFARPEAPRTPYLVRFRPGSSVPFFIDCIREILSFH